MKDNWYPRTKGTQRKLVCPVCSGKGKRKDEKTKKLRPCVLCRGTGEGKWKN